MTDYFTGQIGVSLPITLTDYAAYTSAAMQSLAGIVGGAESVATSGGNPLEISKGIGEFESSMFSLQQNSVNNFNTSKGTSSSLLNHFLPNYVYVIFEIVETDETDNLNVLEGRRTNASGNISNFSGYLQVESVKLKCNNATDNEKDEIIGLLRSGIYI